MFYERYLFLCEREGLAPSTAATNAGFNRGTVSVWKKKYEAGQDVSPDQDTISKICAYFRCRESWLRGLSATEEPTVKTPSLSGKEGESHMFNSVQYVRDVCQQRKIPIAKLEKECGFSNGYLNPKKMTKIPYERAQRISQYLSIPVEVILTGENNKKAPTPAGERPVSDDDMKAAFYDGYSDNLSQDDIDMLWEDAKEYARFKAEQLLKKK